MVILREPGSGTRAVVEAAFAHEGLTIEPVMSVSKTEPIKRMLMSKSSIAYVCSFSVKDEIRRGDLIALTVKDLRIKRSLLSRVSKDGRSLRVPRPFSTSHLYLASRQIEQV
jgi:DNA-binding transcriptional LysR family regulator